MADAGMGGLLARKYNILQEQADAANRMSWAQTGLIGAQTSAYPMEAAARAQAARGAGAAGFGQANLSNANAVQVPGLAASEESLHGAQSADYLSHAGYQNRFAFSPVPGGAWAADQRYGLNGAPVRSAPGAPGMTGVGPGDWGYETSAPAAPGTSGARWNTGGGGIDVTGGSGGTTGLTGFAPDASRVPIVSNGNAPQTGWTNLSRITTLNKGDDDVIDGKPKPKGYNDGTSKVPGDGPGTVDSVNAKLAPGEAVLNAAAAEHLGRSTIDFLNAIGAHRMGLDADPGSSKDKSSPTKEKAGDDPKISQQTGVLPGYAWGGSDVGVSGVPAAGQTITSGSWDPNEAATMQQQNVGLPENKTPPAPMGGFSGGGGQRFDPRAATGITGVPRGYAKGTSNVSKKASKAALPPPGIMQALMAMGGAPGGGGGMPPVGGPGGAQPMPMPMPQVAAR